MRVFLLMLLLGARGGLLPAGTPAPAIEARGADGHPVGQDLEGSITIVDFFATWCPHCRRALPDYDRLKAAFGDRVRLVIIDVEEDPAKVRAFFARRRLPEGAELGLDRSGATARAWAVGGFPTVYVLDQRGIVRDAWSGWGDDSYRTLSQMIPVLEKEDARRQSPAGPRAGKRGRPAADRSKRALSSEDERARAMGVEILH